MVKDIQPAVYVDGIIYLFTYILASSAWLIFVSESGGPWASIHEAIRRPTAKSREVSKPRDWML